MHLKTHLKTLYLDGVIEFVASESSHVEKDFSQGISHSRFGTLQTFDKSFVALARRPSKSGGFIKKRGRVGHSVNRSTYLQRNQSNIKSIPSHRGVIA